MVIQKISAGAIELWKAAMPWLAPGEQSAGSALLRELAKGGLVDIARLAGALDWSSAQVEALLRSSAPRPFVYWGERGRVEGCYGLSAQPHASPLHHHCRIALDLVRPGLLVSAGAPP